MQHPSAAECEMGSCCEAVSGAAGFEMRSCREAVQSAAEYLRRAGVPEPEDNAWQLFSFVTGMSRTRYYVSLQEKVPAETEAAYREVLARRAGREPLQYITGSQEFMGFSFEVTPDVLIPRQDTETLVEEAFSWALKEKEQEERPLRLLDLCTGSGCVGLSLFLLLRQKGADCSLTATDISKEALSVAQRNADRLVSEADRNRITFLQGDLLQPVEDAFDVIVSNPPYIPSSVIEGLMDEVKDHEPRLALDGSGDGLCFYRRIAEDCREHMKKGGRFFAEIGYDQGETTAAVFRESGWRNISVMRDLSGNPRVLAAGLSVYNSPS